MDTFNTPEPISVDITIGVGNVRILASDRTDTTVDIRPRDPNNDRDVQAAELAYVELTGPALCVKTSRSWRAIGPRKNDGSVEVVLEVPTNTNVSGHLAFGDFDADGQLGNCTIKSAMGHLRLAEAHDLHLVTAFGDITVDRCTGDAHLVSSTGKIRVANIEGSASIKNSNGETSLGSVVGELNIKAANGNIIVDHAMRSVVAKAACGSVRVGEVVAGDIVLQTRAGEIAVGVREGSNVWLDAASKYGRITNALTAGPAPSPDAPAVSVRVRTSAGNVTVDRAT